jgi:uncharacterized protein
MKSLSILIKPVSSACKMHCEYCFYRDVSSLRKVKSFGTMSKMVMDQLIEQVYLDLNHGDSMTFAFQGGEPTLSGLEFFKSFVLYVKNQTEKSILIIYYKPMG